ncbi:homocysteine S-methyltransferase [Naasia lichenicola]|uniref:Homocysteine S-methyltransferase n=1 Tax=Naasia lichenicola TaxID=2565933 RepID=A0A4S4FP64_9MICO|nr:homocysteine S-methyltransferase [Naasia lichenicola]THG32370.1 homocysteine S-methyltransferase [Naasia lichenicola]
MSTATLLRALASGPIVLDGGLGTLLEAHGHDLSSGLWSARLLAERPEVIADAHREFVDAGARIVISASYQSTFEGYAGIGIDATQASALMRISVDLARSAAADRQAWVAASVGPYGAMLADGSEYRGDYGMSVDELRDWHRPRIAALASAGADLLAAETIPCLAEVQAVAAEFDAAGAPGWISITVHDGRLRSGESMADAFRIAASFPAVLAIGVNCSAPAEISDALRIARETTDLPFVAYPNSGEGWDATNRTWLGSAAFPDTLVRDWLDGGASVIGGCCRVGPAQIRGMADVVHDQSRAAPEVPPQAESPQEAPR